MSPLNKKAVRQAVRAEIAKLSEEEKKFLSASIFEKI